MTKPKKPPKIKRPSKSAFRLFQEKEIKDERRDSLPDRVPDTSYENSLRNQMLR